MRMGQGSLGGIFIRGIAYMEILCPALGLQPTHLQRNSLDMSSSLEVSLCLLGAWFRRCNAFKLLSYANSQPRTRFRAMLHHRPDHPVAAPNPPRQPHLKMVAERQTCSLYIVAFLRHVSRPPRATGANDQPTPSFYTSDSMGYASLVAWGAASMCARRSEGGRRRS